MNNQQNSNKITQQRVMIFIDGSNLYHVLKQQTDKHDLDYAKFAQKLSRNRNLIRTYYYNIRQDETVNPQLAKNQDRFLNALYETEYLEVRLGIWKPRGQTMVEKGVDVMIAADLISRAYEDHYDIAILVSGDADFYPAIQAVKEIGKQVEVAAFDTNLSSEAARAADVIIRFDNRYFEGLWMSNRKKNELARTASIRNRVTDEAASPNGEDKQHTRTNGKSIPISRNQNNNRRKININPNNAEQNGKILTPNIRQNHNKRQIHANNNSKPTNQTHKPTSTETNSSKRTRESWISKMFRSRK